MNYYGGGRGSVGSAVFGLFAMGIILMIRLAVTALVGTLVVLGVIGGMAWGAVQYYRERGDRDAINDIMSWEPVTGAPMPVMSPVEDKEDH